MIDDPSCHDVSIQLISLASRDSILTPIDLLLSSVSIQLISLASRDVSLSPYRKGGDIVSIQLISLASRDVEIVEEPLAMRNLVSIQLISLASRDYTQGVDSILPSLFPFS